jgi:hypothetical protein
MQPLHQDVLSTLEFVMFAHFSQWASGSTYILVEPVQDDMNFKLKKQGALTATHTKELDSTTEEVDFWQGKYREAMKTIWKTKHHCPQDQETRYDAETEEFSPHSLPRKMAMHAPPTYILPNDIEGRE